jgi:hypothetical protein
MISRNISFPLFASFRRFKFFSFLVLITLSSWQCVSPPDFVGRDLLPPQDVFRVKTDTSFSLSAFTQKYDSINSSNFTNAIVGETYDAVFGKSISSFLTQLSLPRVAHKFGTNPVVDSAFLFLSLGAQLGNEPIQIGVYELADSLAADSAYNGLANIDKFVDPVEIGASVLSYNGDETILKIPIDTSWVKNKLILPTYVDTNMMMSQANFLKYVFGIRVAPKNSFAGYAKGMYYFDYTNSNSKLSIYYKNDEHETDTTNTNSSFSYVFTRDNSRFNHFQHDFSLADPSISISFNSEDPTQDSVFYVKGLGAARGKIVFDDIMNWLDSMPIAINRAELRFELEEQPALPADTLLTNLTLYTLENSVKTELLDRIINEENFGGKYNKSKKNYSFNITHHIQSLLNDPEKDRIILVEPLFASQRANGAVLRSGSHSHKIKLIITYTKF